MASADEVLYKSDDDVAVITINRPAQRNALNRAVREGLYDAFARFEASAAKVAVLTGAGEVAFCAGMDLKEAAETEMGVPPMGFLPIIGDTVDLSKPTIAAVNGIAYAGGWLMAQMCDLCVAGENASFAITEAKIGRGMPWATPLIHMIPQRIMLELLMTGRPITARRAYEIGFVNHVVAPAEVLSTATGIARDIAANAPLTVRAARQMVFAATAAERSEAGRRAMEIFEPVYRSEDALEGPRAYREKRKPLWKGR